MIQKFITQNTCKIPITSTIRFMDIKKKSDFKNLQQTFTKHTLKTFMKKPFVLLQCSLQIKL